MMHAARTREIFPEVFRNIFCVMDTKLAPATNVTRVVKRFNIWETCSRQQGCSFFAEHKVQFQLGASPSPPTPPPPNPTPRHLTPVPLRIGGHLTRDTCSWNWLIHWDHVNGYEATNKAAATTMCPRFAGALGFISRPHESRLTQS